MQFIIGLQPQSHLLQQRESVFAFALHSLLSPSFLFFPYTSKAYLCSDPSFFCTPIFSDLHGNLLMPHIREHPSALMSGSTRRPLGSTTIFPNISLYSAAKDFFAVPQATELYPAAGRPHFVPSSRAFAAVRTTNIHKNARPDPYSAMTRPCTTPKTCRAVIWNKN